MLHLVLGQRAGRLVQHQYARIIGNGFADFHHLALGHGQLADDLLRVHIDLQPFEDRPGLVVHPLAVHDAQLVGGETAQPDIFHHVAAQHLVQLLVDHGHAVVQRVPGACERHGLSIHRDGAAVAGVDAEKALHQRGLARAVFTHQRVYRAGAQLELCVVQRLDAGKLLFNIQHFQQVLTF